MHLTIPCRLTREAYSGPLHVGKRLRPVRLLLSDFLIGGTGVKRVALLCRVKAWCEERAMQHETDNPKLLKL
jgi:hypothetical protein